MVGHKYTTSNTQSRQTDQEEIKESEEINLKTMSSCDRKSKSTGIVFISYNSPKQEQPSKEINII